MKNEDDVAAAATNALQDYTNCPDWGKGGRYIYDPLTKTRTRVDEEPAGEAATAEAAPRAAGSTAAAETEAPQKKERTRA